jgi:hypothetical protein
MKQPIEKGALVVVYGRRDIIPRVIDVNYVDCEARWVITLDWGEFGLSRVYDHDEDKVWYRYSSAN